MPGLCGMLLVQQVFHAGAWGAGSLRRLSAAAACGPYQRLHPGRADAFQLLGPLLPLLGEVPRLAPDTSNDNEAPKALEPKARKNRELQDDVNTGREPHRTGQCA
eukprot:4561609-Pyramimonas_sp.AAC.3